MLKHSKFGLFLAFSLILAMTMISGISCSKTTEPATLSLEESNKRIARFTTHVAAVGLGEDLKNIKDENQRIQHIRNFIDPIRFFNDESGYFYVYYHCCPR